MQIWQTGNDDVNTTYMLSGANKLPRVAKEHETWTAYQVPSQSKSNANKLPYKESKILLLQNCVIPVTHGDDKVGQVILKVQTCSCGWSAIYMSQKRHNLDYSFMLLCCFLQLKSSWCVHVLMLSVVSYCKLLYSHQYSYEIWTHKTNTGSIIVQLYKVSLHIKTTCNSISRVYFRLYIQIGIIIIIGTGFI